MAVYSDMVLMLQLGALLLTFLSLLIIISQYQARQDQRRWQASHEELHRIERQRAEDTADRLDRLERQVDRVVPIARVTFTPPKSGTLELNTFDDDDFIP